MKKLIFFSLFMVILFSCKKKDDVPPIIPTYTLTVSINDTGSIIDANKNYNIAIFKSQADYDNRKPGIDGITTSNSTTTSFKGLTNQTVYVYAGNTSVTDETKTLTKVVVDANKSIVIDLNN